MDKLRFYLKSEKGNDVPHALGYSRHGTVELFKFVHLKPSEQRKTIVVDGETGNWAWQKTYVSAEVAARRLLALGMSGVYAQSVDEFVTATQEAADTLLAQIRPVDTKTTHVRIYKETLDLLTANSERLGLDSSAAGLHAAVLAWINAEAV